MILGWFSRVIGNISIGCVDDAPAIGLGVCVIAGVEGVMEIGVGISIVLLVYIGHEDEDHEGVD